MKAQSLVIADGFSTFIGLLVMFINEQHKNNQNIRKPVEHDQYMIIHEQNSKILAKIQIRQPVKPMLGGSWKLLQCFMVGPTRKWH